VSLVGGFVVLVGVVAGLSIWKTLRDTRALFERHFQTFEAQHIRPLVDAASRQVRSTRLVGSLALVEASTVLFDGLLEQFRLLVAALSSASQGQEHAPRIADAEAEFGVLARVISYQLALLTYDPIQVQDTCQKVSALCRSPDPRVRRALDTVGPWLEAILIEHLDEPELLSIRIDLQRCLDDLRRA
jgi:hypothetical protein